MNESKIIEFLPEHLLMFDDIEGRLDKVDRLKTGELHKQLGPSYSLDVDGKIVWCGGIHLLWPGVGESWVCIRAGCEGPHAVKMIRDMLEREIRKNHLVRVQAIIPVGQKWARIERFLGFSYEGTMRKFAPGGVDKAMWARVNYGN